MARCDWPRESEARGSLTGGEWDAQAASGWGGGHVTPASAICGVSSVPHVGEEEGRGGRGGGSRHPTRALWQPAPTFIHPAGPFRVEAGSQICSEDGYLVSSKTSSCFLV